MTDNSGSPERTEKIEGLGEDRIQGVFSTQSVVKVGTGTTQRKTIQKTFWFCNENDAGDVVVQPLNLNYVPSGPTRDVPRDDFLGKFNPEPEFYVSTVFPKMQELNETIVRGEKHRSRGAAYSAEFEFKQATNLDEENVRANFGLGLTYLDRGEQTKANDIFKRLVKLEAAFEEEHKHLFNDFGINLRKNSMFDQALEYYLRAEELVEDDENLYHNIARVYYEKGELDECIKYLKKSLELNPRMEESLQFLDFLNKEQQGSGGGSTAAADKESLDLSMK
ncbi:tetratricopeptide repeat protein [Pseudodesulfovibrio senegalensis]|jgi:tetratricopeptide (TPR) repeat protein|uniref:Tetratricopeptide repeat protein n=1 Tax=Pseudodesulfovibrio senegalensis TaxID=1721087 RepID=A0A6N6N7B4_9BACT|nr:tetratricopeptide repeat protein [Pseudodesulfovibrio senegalensis]KAB1443309.1 tetratricopeptide repeat protein [Pseudodesulfovibrio senegalensis]